MDKLPKRWDTKQEEDVLKFWMENKIYQKWKLSQREKPNFNFLEGPPYTTGNVHLGHTWNRTLKDIVLRYRAKKGYNVWLQSGFDMHGLPIEEKVEKKLGIKNKKEIEKIGVQKFIEECKKFAYGSMRSFIELYERIAHWQDTDNPYLPITNEYIERVWSMFKKAHERGLLYEGEKPVWWCPRCQTTLSKQEIELGYEDAKYKPAIDPSIFVKFKLKEPNTYLVIWTTTPWTLTFNLGVMVNPNIEYALVELPRVYVKELEIDDENKKVSKEVLEYENEKEYWIVAKDLVEKLMNKLGVQEYKIVKTFLGKELEGKEYIHPFYEELKEVLENIKRNNPNAFTIWLSEEYVNTEEGTGLVHAAPGCGPEDYEVAQKYNVKPFNTVDEEGYVRNLQPFEGWRVKFEDLKWVNLLKDKKALIYFEWYEHDYPICWRCRTRLIIRTTKQWFLNIQKLKDELLQDLKKIRYIPEFAKEAFANVIKTAPDWVVSRQRYWGIPLPVWRCSNGHIYVVGSIKELEELTGKKFKKVYIVVKKSEYAEDMLKEYYNIENKVEAKEEDLLDLIEKVDNETFIFVDNLKESTIDKITQKYFIVRSLGQRDYELIRVYNYDLHKPFVDTFTFRCPVCNDVMKRVPDVVDVWVDSGSAPYASRYPPIYPIDFIIEGLDQLRGWFYSLAILGKIYFENIPYKNVYVHGFTLDSQGLKMSKSLGNVIDPFDLIKEYGADAVRLYLSSAAKAYEDIKIDPKEIKVKLDSLNILWNTHIYLIEQAKYYNVNPKEVKPELDWSDRYMLHLLEKTKKEVEVALENYELWKVGRLLEKLYTELSRFYIKLNRERLQDDPKTVLWVIYTVLKDTINMLSIVTPFIAEKIYQNLKEAFGEDYESIHLIPWPEIREEYINNEIEKEAEILKQVLESGLRLRDNLGISLRWPLKEVYIEPKDEKIEIILKKLTDIIKVKLNVKKVNIGKIRSYEKSEDKNFYIAYNTEEDEELLKEGLLREIQRRLQNLRKELGLRKGEKIIFILKTDEYIKSIIEENLSKLSKVTDSTIFFEDIRINVKKEKEFKIKEHVIKVKAGFE